MLQAPRALLAGLLAAAVVLPGCSGPGEGTATPLPGDPGDPTAPGLGLPAWALGDAWTYRSGNGEVTYVVTGDQGADWVLDTPNPETAFFDARTDVSRLGPVRKSDLAGSQGSDRVEFFRFPLKAGDTWTTRWDGQEVRMLVTQADAAGASFTATAGTSLLYSYTYDAAAGWFGTIEHHAPDGSVDFRLELVDAEHGYSGTVVRWHLTPLLSGQGNASFADARPLEVGNATDVWAEWHMTCGPNSGYTLTFQPVNPGLAFQQGHLDGDMCAQVDFAGVLVETPHPGTWLFGIDVGGESVSWRFELLERRLETIAVP